MIQKIACDIGTGNKRSFSPVTARQKSYNFVDEIVSWPLDLRRLYGCVYKSDFGIGPNPKIPFFATDGILVILSVVLSSLL